MNIYIASRTRHAPLWRQTRAQGIKIISSWIDEAGENETVDLAELWTRVQREVRSADRLIFYAEEHDFPLKGALIEVGMALMVGIPVYLVLNNVKFDPRYPRSFRPVGSWLNHPGVHRSTLDDALSEWNAP